MDFNKLVENTGLIVWLIIGLVAVFVLLFLPFMVLGKLQKSGKTVPFVSAHPFIAWILWLVLVYLVFKRLNI